MRVLAAITLSIASGGVTATAQSSSSGFREDSREVRLIAHRYGDCVVKKDAASAASFVVLIAHDKRSEHERDRLASRVTDPACLISASRSFGGIRMRFPNDTMRYTMADALFRAQLSQSPPIGPLSAVPVLALPPFDEADFQPPPGKRLSKARLEELTIMRDRAMARSYLWQFGECVVRTDPSRAFALLKTAPVTPEENGAFAGLQPALGQCVVEGQQVELNKALLRGTVALAYYRLARQQRASALTGAGQK
jgi:hypothetical protein